MEELFAALGTDARLLILDLIRRHDGINNQEIVEQMRLHKRPIDQPTVSHHLRVLRQANLITSTVNGLYRHYSIVPETFLTLQRYLDVFVKVTIS